MEDQQKGRKYTSVKKLDIRTFTMVVVLIILWIVFTFLTSDGLKSIERSFISYRNLSNLLRQMAVVGILGSSMVLIIVTGGIDLSAGVVAGFIGCVAAGLQVFFGVDTVPTVIISMISGALIYLFQGSLIAYLGLAPFIVTLGGQLVFRGLVLSITNSSTIAPLKESLRFLGQAYLSQQLSIFIGIVIFIIFLMREISRRRSKVKHKTLVETKKEMLLRLIIFAAGIFLIVLIMNNYRGMPLPVIIMLAVTMILTLIAERTTFGRSIYAIGGNIDAAKYSGIKVKKNLVIIYTIHGVVVSIAGLILAARLNAGTTTVSNMNLELDAIAAAVIGGTSMTGGVGKVVGALLGALIMASIDNGMSMMNMDAYWQYIFKGIILVAAVWFDIYTRSRKK
jgi:D-xylose transport system permease protein